jgi:phosphatidylglycerophosphate synthase
LLDVLAGKGPRLSALLSGVSFCRLFLKLAEKRESQVWTWPNLVTVLRIAGVVAVVALYTGPTKAPQPPSSDLGAALSQPPSGPEEQPPGPVGGLEDWVVCLLGAGFVAMDLLDGWLARKLSQQTKLGAELDGLGDALGTGWLALTLWGKRRLPGLLALHLAAAPYLWPLANLAANSAAPKQRLQQQQQAKHPWARPAAGAMALLALLAVALPAAFPAALHLELDLDPPSTLRRPPHARGAAEALARGCATLAGLVNLASFGLSYLTLFGVKVPGNGLLGHEHSK